MKKVFVLGGGTVFHVRPHLALCAPAYGKVMRSIARMIENHIDLNRYEIPKDAATMARSFYGSVETTMVPTRMADASSTIETNDDVAGALANIVNSPDSKMVFLSTALCDFDATVVGQGQTRELVGKGGERLKSDLDYQLKLVGAKKLIGSVRETRKDIFLVGFKTTAGQSLQGQFVAGLKLLKEASCNLVLANDIHTRTCMIISPEEVPYCITNDREKVLRNLVAMAGARASLHFTRSTVVEGERIPWYGEQTPSALRAVVDHCIDAGAYKPFLGKTVGHFAYKLDERRVVTSIRKSNFNKMAMSGMVMIEADGDDSVIAHGARPSVGGQSQRIIFREHKDVDSIVHFHCPPKPGVIESGAISVRSQFQFECGSHECGKNTSDGLREHDFQGAKIKAVYLEGHGPNIVFHRSVHPLGVVEFIEKHFDLSKSTGEAAINRALGAAA